MAIDTFPQSLEAEEAVVGSVLLKGNDVFSKCNGWIRDSEAFYNYDLNHNQLASLYHFDDSSNH